MIKSIRIRNFKSLRDVSVDLEPITVLVGRGGTGKSNFVNAIAFLRDCLLAKNRSFPGGDDLNKIVCATAEPIQTGKWPPIQIELQLEVPGDVRVYAYRLAVSFPHGHLTIDKEGFFRDGVAIFERDANKWLTQPALRPVPALAGLTLEMANGIPEVGFAYVILTAGIGCYDFPGSVLEQGNKNQQQGNNAGLKDDASNFLECLEAITRNLQNVSAQQEIIAALRSLKPALRALQIAVPSRDRAIVTLRGERSDTDIVFDLSQESEGFRRFLAHLIALNQVPPKVLVTLEEPEKGLYAGALSALAEQIKAFPERSGGQIILTTHSPLLLDNFNAEQIRVVEMENLETKIGPISEPQMQSLRDQLETTGELLTVDPARLA
jgi:predicted ATPase